MLRDYLPDLRKRSVDVQRPQRMYDFMDSFFNDFFESFPRGDIAYPKVNVSENDKEVKVQAELPGMEPKDIDISFQNGTLLLKGEKRFEDEKREGNFHRMECSYGSVHRAIPLPAEIDADKIEAKFKNGVLNITMPKAETAKSKKIEIQS